MKPHLPPRTPLTTNSHPLFLSLFSKTNSSHPRKKGNIWYIAWNQNRKTGLGVVVERSLFLCGNFGHSLNNNKIIIIIKKIQNQIGGEGGGGGESNENFWKKKPRINSVGWQKTRVEKKKTKPRPVAFAASHPKLQRTSGGGGAPHFDAQHITLEFFLWGFVSPLL